MVLVPALLVVGDGGWSFSPLDAAAAPHRYNLVSWEISHLPDKWLHKINSWLPWNSRSQEDRLDDLKEFFDLGQEIWILQGELSRLQAGVSNEPADQPLLADQGTNGLLERLENLENRWSDLRPGVEETLESRISSLLSQQGLGLPLGILFPPVDVSLTSPPRVLIISPRDRIERIETVLIEPDINLQEMGVLEDRVLQQMDLAALVEGIGGVATYPTTVRGNAGLRRAAITSAHEWLHTYWFFRPLGWNFYNSPEMTTLNETAADLAGEELGLKVYEALTGHLVEQPTVSSTPSNGGAQVTPEEDPDTFSFNVEMRETRLRVDDLLAQDEIEQAEAYMEQRRQLFVANGFPIRKLNQAYFAFHGTYASSPASISPIGTEVEQLRGMTESLGDFIKTMAGFGSYEEFLGYLSRTSSSQAPTEGMVRSYAPARG